MGIVEETGTKAHPHSKSILWLTVFGAEFMVTEPDASGEADVIETVRKKGRFTNYLVAKVQMQDGNWWIESPQRWSARGREREPSIGADTLKGALEEVGIVDWMAGKTVPRFEPKGQRSIVVKRRGHSNMLRDLEKRTDALRKGMAQTDLSWNPKLQKQLRRLLRKSEKTVSQFHDAELKHTLHGRGAHLSFPSLPRTAQLLDELAGAGLLFAGDPAGVLPLVASANRGQRALRLGDPRTPQQALVLALVLAIQAPTARDSKEAIAAALQIMKLFKLSERDLERAQASADMIDSVESLQVEGKTLEDLMREGVILPTTMGPPGEANQAVRYLYVGEYDRKPPPKTWAKKEASYYSGRLARKAKAVGGKAWQDYLHLPGVWLLVRARADTANSARGLLERALNGSELAASTITVLADPFDLTKGTPLRGPKYGQPAGTLPPRLKPELPSPRFTIGRKEETRWGGERVQREAGSEIDPSGAVDPQALFMGFYNVPGSHDLEGLPGMRFYVTHAAPFSLQSVSTDSIGYADIPVVKVKALAKDTKNFSADVARPLAVAFAKDQGVVFDLYYPTIGQRRARVTTDRNPASPSYGKNKKMQEVEITFEIPQEQLKRLPREKQKAFTTPWSHRLEWRRDKIDHWLGLDKVEVLAAYRAKKGKLS